jgi:hypothetical protein
MRKEVLRAVRSDFRRKIESGDKFRHTGDRGSPGSDIYVWEFSDDLNCFVYLLPSPKSYQDAFIIELGWSSGLSFPAKARLQNKNRLDFHADGRIRLPSLWREQWKSALEPWWELGLGLSVELGDAFYSKEETLLRVARVPEAVTDAINKLDAYGIPFLHRVAEERDTPSSSMPPT